MNINIGQASQQSGVSKKMIRYYESIQLLSKAPRNRSGYRTYSSKHIEELEMIVQARGLGFSIKQIRVLLELKKDPQRASKDVRKIAQEHMNELDQKINELMELKGSLSRLIESCANNESPACAILDGISHKT
jgi:MerR family copper efflux transcriptional regulator